MESVYPGDVFSVAFRKWIRGYSQHIHERTLADYQQYGSALCDFFGQFAVNEIDHNLLMAYQHWRSREGNEDPEEPEQLKKSRYRHAACAVRIRNEINGCMKPILKHIGTWPAIKQHGFRHLPVRDEGAGIALSREEHVKLMDVAFSCPHWTLDAHCLRIMYRTGTGFGELRKLRRKDVEVASATIRIVHGAKVKPRIRTIALTDSALESVIWIVDRWRRLGGTSPDDYLLPHRKHGFSQPMTSIYFAWKSIKKATAQKYPEMRSILDRLRIYDGRVSVASWLLDNEKLSLPVIKKTLGWAPNSKMQDRYHRKKLEECRAVLLTLEDKDKMGVQHEISASY